MTCITVCMQVGPLQVLKPRQVQFAGTTPLLRYFSNMVQVIIALDPGHLPGDLRVSASEQHKQAK